MTSLLTHFVPDTTLIPFSLWTLHGPEASVLSSINLPHLRTWLALSRRVDVEVDKVQEPLLATMSPPHERAWAQAVGWSVVDGAIPWAALAAAEQGLAVDGESWAFITLCNWHVSNGQVTLGDPADLQIDEETDAKLLDTMKNFFAEDGIALHPYKPGQWLAQSPLLADIRTASLDRVIGRNIDPWLVGSHAPKNLLSPSVKLLRRLQNEMQMFLYTHPVNDGRSLVINSFWVHGTGELTASSNKRKEPVVVQDLRSTALHQDLIGWLELWQFVDSNVIAPMLSRLASGEMQRLVLCGEYEFHVYDSVAPSLWQRLCRLITPVSLDTILGVKPLKD